MIIKKFKYVFFFSWVLGHKVIKLQQLNIYWYLYFSFSSSDHGEHFRITPGLWKCKSHAIKRVLIYLWYVSVYIQYDRLGDSCILCSDACDLTLDPNTAHTRLILSNENRTVTGVKEEQPYPDHPERFQYHEQVLCRESLSGRFYWEVEWSGWSYIAVAYKGLNRKGGSDCRFGWNEKSWSLFCTGERFAAGHNNTNADIPVPSPPRKE